MNDFKINLKSKKSNNLILKILIIFTVFSYLLLSIRNNEIFKYLYEDGKNFVITNIYITYILTIALFAILSYYGLKFEINNNDDDIKLLINMGLKRNQLFEILFRSITFEIIAGFALGLPLGIFLAELVDLISILLFDLNIKSHGINLDIKAIGFTFILFISFVLLSLAIIVLAMGKKYQEKEPTIKFPRLIIQILLILAFVYYGHDNASINFRFTLILLAIDLIIVLFIRKIIKISEGYSYEKSLFLDHIGQSKIIFIFILLALITASTKLYNSFYEISYYMTDANLRPHFTIFEDIDVINDIKKDYKNTFSDIYPINIKDFYGIDYSNFKDEINKQVDLTNYYPVNVPKLMDYSSYKKVFGDKAITQSLDGESIYLYANNTDRTTYDILNQYLENNDTFITIADINLKLRNVDRSDIIFANDMQVESNIFVVSDELFEKILGNPKPIAYNFMVSDEYLNIYGKNQALENIRSDFFKRNIKFESLIWMIKHSYSNILARQFISIHLSIILTFISGLFLAINIMTFFNNKSKDFKVLSVLGDTGNNLLKIKKYHIIRIYGLIIGLSMINYASFVFYQNSVSSENLFFSPKLYVGAFYIFIPALLILIMVASGKLILSKGNDYD